MSAKKAFNGAIYHRLNTLILMKFVVVYTIYSVKNYSIFLKKYFTGGGAGQL